MPVIISMMTVVITVTPVVIDNILDIAAKTTKQL